jgi:hypothetical protein
MHNETFFLPHIKYISSHEGKTKSRYYLGGEPEINHSRLTVGKLYNLRQALFAEKPEDKRIVFWICSDDENKGKVCQIDLKNFGTKSDLRDRNINIILDEV